MIYKKYFALLFVALLPWCSLASFTFRASKMCKSKKYCDASKQMADSFKDFSLQFKNLASAAKILQTDLLILASYVGPVMGFLGVGLGVVAFVLEKQQKDEIKAAVEMLSKKMDVLAIRIHDSTKKIIAHIDVSRFHDKIAKKAEQIYKIYDDFMNERNEKNLNNLKRICAKKTPLDIFDRMEYHLKHDSDQILLSDKYTDEAFEAYHQMYALVETQLICFYHICEELIDENESISESEDIIENRNTLLVKRVTAIKNHFERINGTRMEKVWNVIFPTEIDRWYNEYAQLKVTERKKKESSLKIANQLNADYKELGYKYDVGIIKNRKKEDKLYAFDCKPEICQIKNATDYVLWVTKRKPCPWRKKFEIELSGSLYQLKLLLLFLWRGITNKYIFRMGTEIQEAEKFDDLVFYYKQGKNERFQIRYLQAKSSYYDTTVLKYDDFITDFWKARCNLKKYFVSFRKISQKLFDGDIDDCILCTRIPLPQEMQGATQIVLEKEGNVLMLNDYEVSDVFFTSSERQKWHRYKLDKESVYGNTELMEMFKTSENLMSLADELAYYVAASDEIEADDGKNEVKKDNSKEQKSNQIVLDVNKFWLSKYHEALMNENIIKNQSTVKFNYKFLSACKKVHNKKPYGTIDERTVVTDDIEITITVLELVTAFVEEYEKETKMNIDDLSNVFLNKNLSYILEKKSKRKLIQKCDAEIKKLIMTEIFDEKAEHPGSDLVNQTIAEIKNGQYFDKEGNSVTAKEEYSNKCLEKLKVNIAKNLQNRKFPINKKKNGNDGKKRSINIS